jgi:hypothetical protein
MPLLDDDLLSRAAWWCAASGDPTPERVLRAALEPLSWDELLLVKAVLADPPPPGARGPTGLLGLARVGPMPSGAAAPAIPAPAPPPPKSGAVSSAVPVPRPRAARARSARPAATGPRIRRIRDRAPGTAHVPASLPLLDDLFREEGRGVLERTLRRRGASRPLLAGALAEGWRRGDGSAPGPEDVDRLLAHHGLARAFQERERALLLHTLRRHAGVRPLVATALGYDLAGLDAAVQRLGLRPSVESLRAQARRDLQRRATLAERARLVTSRAETLADLGILEDVDEDLRRRLPEHVRALRAAGSPLPLGLALARSLSIRRDDAEALAARMGIPLDAPRRPVGAVPGGGAGRRPSTGWRDASGGRAGPATPSSGPRGPRPAARRGAREERGPGGERRGPRLERRAPGAERGGRGGRGAPTSGRGVPGGERGPPRAERGRRPADRRGPGEPRRPPGSERREGGARSRDARVRQGPPRNGSRPGGRSGPRTGPRTGGRPPRRPRP